MFDTLRVIFFTSTLVGVGLSADAADFERGLAAAKANDYQTALQELEPLAEQGNVEAQSNLAYLYAVILEDDDKAFYWYRQAAMQGVPRDQYLLAMSYAFGRGVTKDSILAYMWFYISDFNGYPRGYNGVLEYKMTSEDLATSKSLARACIESGYQDCN